MLYYSCDVYDGDDALNRLQHDISSLEENYGEVLREEHTEGDVTCLNNILQDATHGSKQAEAELKRHGPELLENIHLRLKQAAEDLQRLDDEGPTTKVSTGRKIHGLAEATAAVLSAQEHLREAFPDSRF